jgi:hypothetical protein
VSTVGICKKKTLLGTNYEACFSRFVKCENHLVISSSKIGGKKLRLVSQKDWVRICNVTR